MLLASVRVVSEWSYKKYNVCQKKQKKIALQIISNRYEEQRKKLKVRRNNILNKIKDRLKLLEENLLEEELQGIEQKGTTQKAYDAVKTLRKRKPEKKPEVFDTEGNLTNTEKEQAKIVTDIFKETFEIPDMEESAKTERKKEHNVDRYHPKRSEG